MNYLDWLKTLPKSDAEYATAPCPTCLASCGLKYQYFGFADSEFGWKLVWCAMCQTGIQVSRVRIPHGAPAISDTVEQQRFIEEVGPLKLIF